MRNHFLVDTCGSERVKVIGIWSEFADEDLALAARPRLGDPRGRSADKHLMHRGQVCHAVGAFANQMVREALRIAAALGGRGGVRQS